MRLKHIYFLTFQVAGIYLDRIACRLSGWGKSAKIKVVTDRFLIFSKKYIILIKYASIRQMITINS
jgi:hypothetical protein